MGSFILLTFGVVSLPFLSVAQLYCNEENGKRCPLSLHDKPSSVVSCTDRRAIRQEIQTDVINLINSEVNPQLSEVLNQKYLGLNHRFPAANCTHILNAHPTIESGMYWLKNHMETVFQAYCDFGLICDSSNRTGWMRIANFDLTDPEQTTCPNNQFTLRKGTERYCLRTATGWGCNEHTYSVSSIPYTRVCGRATGIQIGGTDGFFDQAPNRPINAVYVDGVSLTYVNSNGITLALWSFAASHTDDVLTCPCSNGSQNIPPAYVMNNYFCEAGAPFINQGPIDNFVYFDDKLWDGMMCTSVESSCCSGHFKPPWFFRDIGFERSDIKMRLCSDMGGAEEVGLTQLFIYVQ